MENHTHISSLRDSGKHRGRCYPYYAPNGAPDNNRAVATHISPLTGLRKTTGPLIPITFDQEPFLFLIYANRGAEDELSTLNHHFAIVFARASSCSQSCGEPSSVISGMPHR